MPRAIWPWVLVILAAMATALVPLAFWWRRYLARFGYIKTLQDLENLDRAGPVAEGTEKEFFRRLNRIIRKYVQNCYGIRLGHGAAALLLRKIAGAAARPDCRLSRTNLELLADLEGNDVDEDVRRRIAAVLAVCDLVKFAGHRPSARAAREALDAARQFVHATWQSQPGREGRP